MADSRRRESMPLTLSKPCVPIILLFVHLFVVVSVLLVFVWADNEDTEKLFLGGLNFGEQLFNWHPVFMVWGTSCLLEGAVAYRSMHFYPHAVKKRMHAFWTFVGVVLIACGLIVVFTYKHEHHIASLYSTHSWLGIFTSTIIFAQFALGFLVYGSCSLAPLMRFVRGSSSASSSRWASDRASSTTLACRQRAYPLHATLGLTASVSAVASVISGLDHENTLLGCAYSVVNKDLDPASHYTDIPKGCRLSNGIAVIFMVLLLLFVYVMTNLKSSGAAFAPDDDGDNAGSFPFSSHGLSGSSSEWGLFPTQRLDLDDHDHDGGGEQGALLASGGCVGGGGGMTRAQLDQQTLLSERTVYYGGLGGGSSSFGGAAAGRRGGAAGGGGGRRDESSALPPFHENVTFVVGDDDEVLT